MVFDTLATARALKEAGLEERQAEAIAEAIREGQGDLATKTDIEALKSDIEKLRFESKADLEKTKVELKADIEKFRGEAKTDLEKFRGEAKTDLERAVNRMLLAQIAVAGVLLAAIKLLP
ncbi:MAG: hypothetical protein OXL41_00100 [Nitrospinae bacterium]|nr:hypothetical protein [Nitrospinota bacterium]